MKIVRLAFRLYAACFLVLLSACSIFSDDESEPAELVDFEESIELDSQWSRGIGDQGAEEFYLRLTPAIDGNVIYAANIDGKVYAIDRVEVDRLWKVDVDADLVSAVGAGGGLVLVGTVEGILIALRQEDGSEVWRVPLSSEMLSAAQVDGDVVVVQTMDGKATGLNALSGEKIWVYTTSVPPLTLRMSATPLLENGVAYLAFSNGTVLALNDRNGLLLWEQQVTLPQGRNELERLINFDGKPLLSGNDLYVASYQGNAVSLDKNRGALQWEQKLSALGALSAGEGNLYLSQSDDSIIALKMATGRLLWENKQLSQRRVTAPVLLGDYLVVADGEGYLHLLQQSDGSFAGRKHIGGDGVRNPLLSDNETLYVLTNSGRLRAYQLEQP